MATRERPLDRGDRVAVSILGFNAAAVSHLLVDAKQLFW
jgi:hypothetical protein